MLGQRIIHRAFLGRSQGLPVVEAPGEAEATCAALCAAGLVKAVATSDGDALLYGAERVYQVIKLKARDRRPLGTWGICSCGGCMPPIGAVLIRHRRIRLCKAHLSSVVHAR